MNLFEAVNIAKNFPTNRAIDSLSFDTQSGEVLALLGPDGAGETTTLRILFDIPEPDSGTIRVFDSPLCQDIGDAKVASQTESALD